MAASIRELAHGASFIFEGTLRRTGAVTSAALELAPEMAVVHVDRILRGPSMFEGFKGREITVQLREADEALQGRELTFFTTGLHFGESLAVRELGHIDSRGREVEREVHEAADEKRNEQLLERLRDAELVVAGQAIRVGPHKLPEDAPRRVSEHDPDWWECVIRVEDVLKGKLQSSGRGRANGQAVTLFANSRDILWYHSPKFSEGLHGIWLIHATDFRGKPVPAPVSDHPLDFHPHAELGHIRLLMDRL